MEEKKARWQPEALFHYFEVISAIPRGSKNEKAVSDYICAFAQKKGLEYHQDQLYNVIVKKPGSKGCEQLPAVMLQGHLDMVCEKNADTVHDFEKDGIRLQQKEGFLTADGTTLGADNGIALAMMLALLEDDAAVHPPLECVFTVQEEIGLIGAAMLDGSLLHAKTMINLDSEEEGIATVSCAGGLRMEMTYPITWQPAADKPACRIRISGLPGGHSGADIHLERSNANKLMGRVLYTLSQEQPFVLSSFNGGNKDNAIPRECEAVIVFASVQEQTAGMNFLERFAKLLEEEITPAEPHFQLQCEGVQAGKMMNRALSDALIKLVYLAPNGVLNRNVKQGGFVVASLNLGVIRTETDSVSVIFAPRSSVASLQAEIKQRLTLLGRECGFAVTADGEYPGWSYAEHSPIRELFQERYRVLFGKELRIEAIHAGLECGLFQSKLPGLDAIAVGPNIFNCHTPEERLELASCERTFALLTDVLAHLTR